MSATSILAGLLGGINESAEANRAEIRRREDEQDQFERRELQRIASSPEYMPEIRDRAATALLDLASNPGRRRKGSFTENLMGVNRIQAHPAVSELMRFMREPETKGGLPQGLVEAPPKAIPATPPPAVTTPPTTAAMPPTPAGQPGGGPPSAGALGSPGTAPRQAAAPTPPPLAPGLLPVNQSTGAPPQTQGPSVTVPRRILRSPAEIAIETARAKAQGDTEGEIEGLIASGMPREQALEVVRLGKIRSARLGAARDSYAEGEVIRKPDGTYVQILYNRYDPTDRIELPAMAPSLLSRAVPNERALKAVELFGPRYPHLAGDPTALLRAISPAESAVLDQTLRRLNVQQVGQEARARGDEAIKTELGMPVGVTAGAAQGVSPTTPLSAFEGITPITTEQRERLTAAKTLEAAIVGNPANPADPGIKTLITRVFPNTSGLLGGLTASAVLAAKRMSRDPDYARLEAKIALALGNVAKVVAGESGRLTEQDAERAKTALSALQSGLLSGDTSESALARLSELENSLANIARDIKTPAEQMRGRADSPPQVGDVVGEPVPTGARLGTAPDGSRVANIPGVGIVPIRQTRDGRWVY